MFLAIFHFDELLLTCWTAINHLDCMSKSTFPSRFYFFLLIFYLSSFLPDLHFSFLIFIFFLLLSDPSFFLFVIMVSFYSWSSSSSDHLPTVFCLCSAPFIHFLPDLKYFSSASIEVHFPWNKVFLLLLSLFKRKGEKMSVWSLSLFTLSWLPFFSLWYLILR